jgi:hypothetical protein
MNLLCLSAPQLEGSNSTPIGAPPPTFMDELSQELAKLKTYICCHKLTFPFSFSNLQTTPLLLIIINHGTRLETDSC